jgi:hypothetical protein
MRKRDPVKNRKHGADWRRRHPGKHAVALRQWRMKLGEEMKLRQRAYDKVQRALKKGVLVRGPCEMEGEGEGCNGRIHAHHEDYEKPLDVRWLCHRHHLQAHWRKQP